MRFGERETVAAAVSAAFRCEGGMPEPSPSVSLTERGLLYLSLSPRLTQSQFESVSRGSEEVGDKWFYLAHVERSHSEQRLPPLSASTLHDFRLGAHDYEGYLQSVPPSGASHVLVSPSNIWGVYVEDEGVAVVAGDENFVSAVYADQPPALDQAVHFAGDILSAKVPGLERWVAELLRDVLGPEAADEVLSKAAAAQASVPE